MASTKIPQSPGPSPRKRVKLEETPPANQEIAAARKLILDERYIQMRELKESYVEHLTECFYLQSGQNMMDFLPWKRRPTPQLVEFLKSGRLDSDDEDDNPLIYLQEKDTTKKEMKTLTSSGSGTSTVTTATTLSVTTAQVLEVKTPSGRHGKVFSHQSPPVTMSTTVAVVTTVLTQQAGTTSRMLSQTTSLSTAGQFHRSVSDTKLITMTQSTKMAVTATQSGIKRTPPASPGRHKQNSGSFDNITGVTTQEAIVERAKQEAQVMSRVSELRKEGLWSSRRLPKVQEPPRNKAHWDYLLEEMQWLAADFAQERKWKKAAARKIARMVQKHFQDLEQKEIRAEKEEGMRVKRIAGQMAKMVREFWANIEKVVQYKQTSRLDEKRKKALDLHLNFIVDQTEKYSTWLTEGLKTSSKGSLNTTPASSIAGDDEFKPEESESDDEETIAKDEEAIDESETKDEIAALQKESEVPLDQLLESLPKEILEKPATISSEKEATEKPDDEEFAADEEEEIDVEETIEEQEKHEQKHDVKQELDDLKDEGDLDIEALRAKYAAAYDSDFEMPEDSEEETTEYEDSSEEDEESEEEEEEVDVEAEEEDVGLEALVHSAETAGQTKTETVEEEGPGKQLTDIAAEAASLQPKGYTLQTTEVKTKVPHLLKHTLREYQHVGLDWLATMFEKRLNGILADEMGLGKTIQTIALLAHLACEKSIWGPHLIVVPTSVMLNWEMEFKKWCPAFKILTYYGTMKERKQKRTGWTKTNAFHICITSYKLVIQDHQSFRRKKWKYLILDEAQNIKNFKSQRWQTLLNFNSLRRLLLTGTPLQNSLMELWSLMHFLMPQVFQSHREFKEWFANPLTGMIEGSHEYNEKLIHRLHKVLRPFLLRRLKDDVEKQMPKKYEHIVMCHLAKRQRFLYDEFMAQGKTKETLASGHFMSVINILMQLRKVCNHPSLFDPRPIVSPLQMEGLVYHTASMVLSALKYDPLEDIDIRALFPSLADMEKDLPAFVAHRVRKLQTPRHLIEEIDSQPPPPPRLPAGKLKHGAIRCVSPGIPSGRASPQVLSRSVSPFGHMTTETVSDSSSAAGISQPPLQARVLPQNVLGSGTTTTTTSTPATSQAITVQIQRTDQGTRFVVPSGLLQIVQTSTGQHLIATSSAASSVAPLASASSTVVNGEPVVTMATSSVRTTVSSTMSQVKMSPLQQTSSSSTVRLPDSSAVQDSNKPVMRVSPLAETVNGHSSQDGAIFTSASTSVTSTIPVTSTKTTRSVKHMEDLRKLRKQQFFMEPLYVKRRSRRKEQLDYLVETNRKHCDCKPVYGHDFCDSVNIFKDPYNSKTYTKRDRTLWHGPGTVHCHCAKVCRTPNHPNYLWNQTKVLSEVIHTPEQYLQELGEVLDRFVFAIPPVQCAPLRLHVSHPTPGYIQQERRREHLIHTEVSPLAANYHKISTKMTVQFPELRLIQYDCGKLQTLDILLRRLKTGDHRVLIFTQMTKMLNILESFLSYHGHRYLRLDGTTKVEQRQQLMDRFNADKRIFVFILSTRSGGIGVNLTGADTVIFYDSDWNPTMDAQAQDRCHRIGQTRDVHIYRLISERTVEENILKKANQKRMLGDMAIEGGNFTTTFFKEQTISELFTEPSGLDSLVKEKEEEEREKAEKQEKLEREKRDRKVEKEVKEEDKDEKKIDNKAMVQFEKALAITEDETDVIAAEKVKAEQKAELVEFDENVPWDEQEAANRDDDSKVEKELALLEKELSPIERYAVQFAELQLEPVNAEELLIAEEDIENAKKDWELNRLKALKEEEERRLEFEEDEMLYTFSRDDAYQQVKKNNKQMLIEARRAAAAAKADALSPARKSGRQSMGGYGESCAEWMDTSSMGGTPVLMTGKGRGRKRLSITPKNTPKNTPKQVGKGEKVGAGAKASAVKSKLNKKLKGKIKAVPETNDNNEEIDVETVTKEEETVKQPQKKSPRKKSDKPPKKALKRSPKVMLTPIITSTAHVVTPVSTEATPLKSLPGFSSSNPIDVDSSASPRKREKDRARANIFDKLSPVKPKDKPAQDRANIFEQLSQNLLQNRAPGSNLLTNPLTSGNIRLVNTQHGRQMIVVNAAANPVPAHSTPQNLVLVQAMQGMSQGLLLGNNFVPLQGSPLSVGNLTRGTTPLSLGGLRLQSAPQVMTPQPAHQVVNPQFSPQITPVIQNPGSQAFVQRLVNVQQSPATGNLTQISGLNLGSVQQLTGLTIPRPQTSQILTSVGQQVPPQQIRVQTPPVQTPAIQKPPTPKLTSPRKPPSHTIADLIEARSLANAASKAEKIHTVHSGGGDQSSLGLQKILPNLSNIMRAQGPIATRPYDIESKVRVNPSVAQIIASHINSSAAPVQSDEGKPKVNKPAIISASSTTRAASPTIVKLVASSSLRAGSPVGKAQAVPISSIKPNPAQLTKTAPQQSYSSQQQPARTPVQSSNLLATQPSKTIAQPGKTDNPVATINIKGLPPGVTIPASLVNSLVSGSIWGISKTNLNVLKGVGSTGAPNLRPQAGVPGQALIPRAQTGVPLQASISRPQSGVLSQAQNLRPLAGVSGQAPTHRPQARVTSQPVPLRPQASRTVTPNRTTLSPTTPSPIPEIVHIIGGDDEEIEVTHVTPAPGIVSEMRAAAKPIPAIKTLGSPRPVVAKPVTDPSSPGAMQAWSNPNLVIRTRRAAVQHPTITPQAPTALQTLKPQVLHSQVSQPQVHQPQVPQPQIPQTQVPQFQVPQPASHSGKPIIPQTVQQILKPLVTEAVTQPLKPAVTQAVPQLIQEPLKPTVTQAVPQPIRMSPPPVISQVTEVKPITPTNQPVTNQINVVHVNHTNDEQIAIGVKKLEQNTATAIEVPQSNGDIDS